MRRRRQEQFHKCLGFIGTVTLEETQNFFKLVY
jgi:hypothetical protein